MLRLRKTATAKRWTSHTQIVLAGAILVCTAFYPPIAEAAAKPYESPTANPQDLSRFGQELFFDARLSADGLISCSSCHKAELYFADDIAVSRGVFSRQGTRNTPSLVGTASATAYFWDGRRSSLENLVLNPLTHPNEHGMRLSQLKSVIQSHHLSRWQSLFGAADVSIDGIARALAAFVRTLVPAQSSFEKFAYRGDNFAMTEAQYRGYQLFIGRAECSRCHLIGAQDAPLTDSLYHMGETNFDAQTSMAAAALRISALSQEERFAVVASDEGVSALGRYTVTLRPEDVGLFRTPSLRNVAGTAPYMHDGSVASLQEAVEHEIYWRAPEDARLGRLTPAERTDLVEFLHALTSELNVVSVPFSDLGRGALLERSQPTGKSL